MVDKNDHWIDAFEYAIEQCKEIAHRLYDFLQNINEGEIKKNMTNEENIKALEQNNYYIYEHKANVGKAFTLLETLGIINRGEVIYDELKRNIIAHDMTKFSADEYEPYAKRFFTPNGKVEFADEFDKAWLHHIHCNKHHWNYWVLVDGKDKITALEMPPVYVYEMICDWLSFGFKKGDLTEIKSFNEAKRNEYIFHPNTRKLVDEIIEKIVNGVKEKEIDVCEIATEKKGE
jgi:hypothetical protein